MTIDILIQYLFWPALLLAMAVIAFGWFIGRICR